jgi:hypothetical protein
MLYDLASSFVVENFYCFLRQGLNNVTQMGLELLIILHAEIISMYYHAQLGKVFSY